MTLFYLTVGRHGASAHGLSAHVPVTLTNCFRLVGLIHTERMTTSFLFNPHSSIAKARTLYSLIDIFIGSNKHCPDFSILLQQTFSFNRHNI